MEPRSPPLQVDSLPAEPQGKPKNTGVGGLSLPLHYSGLENSMDSPWGHKDLDTTEDFHFHTTCSY